MFRVRVRVSVSGRILQQRLGTRKGDLGPVRVRVRVSVRVRV